MSGTFDPDWSRRRRWCSRKIWNAAARSARWIGTGFSSSGRMRRG